MTNHFVCRHGEFHLVEVGLSLLRVSDTNHSPNDFPLDSRMSLFNTDTVFECVHACHCFALLLT